LTLAKPSKQLRETKKKDAKAPFLIQSAIDDETFSKIATTTTYHDAWETLKKEFLGEKKLITIKL